MTDTPESFVDMFTTLGRDLKMPNIDVQRIIDHHRKNLEALEKTAKVASAGASTMMERQREMLQEALAEVSDMAQSFRSPGNPQDMMAKQADFAKRSFEAAVKNAGEMAELARKSGTETVEVLRERIREAMNEIRDSYESRK